MWPLGLLLLCSGLAHTQHLDHRFFLVQIIEKYGKNGNITYEGFERLYKNLGLGNTINNQNPVGQHSISEEKNSNWRSRRSQAIDISLIKDSSEEQLTRLVDQHEEVTMSAPPSSQGGAPRCLGPAQLLAVYGVPRSDLGLSPVSFLHLCPAIIYQLDQRSCSWTEHRTGIEAGPGDFTSAEPSVINPHASWVFALLTILVISVSGLVCVAIVPLLHKTFMSQLISFLVALAVGTLLGDAFLHLIPHALEEPEHTHDQHHSHKDSVYKTGLMFSTVVFFFTFEAVLNIKKGKKVDRNTEQNSTYSPVSVLVHQNGNEMIVVGDAARPPQAEGEAYSHNHSNTAVMVIMGDGLHNLTDGLAVGAAFSGGLAPGFATALAVFTHELPHELGDFAVLLQSGVSVRKALLYNVVSSVLSLLGTVIGLCVGNFGGSTRGIYAITAGSFIYIALSNLVPEINRQKSSCRTIFLQLIGILSGGVIMGSIALYEQDIQNLFS